MEISKYKFLNKLLNGVTLLKITPTVTWTQPYIYICVCVYVRERFEFKFSSIKELGNITYSKALEDLT